MNRTLVLLVLAAFMYTIACNDPGKKEPTVTDNAGDNSAVSQPVDSHNAANSLDLAGEYEGTLPCADCEGIKTTLNLNKDSLFTLKEEYLGKKNPLAFNSKGKWVIHGNTVTLQFEKELQERRVQYKAGENKIWLLDQEGLEITGTLAAKYVMTKKQ